MKNPCYNEETKTDCPNRHVGCHGKCERYREFDIANKKRRAENQARKEEAAREFKDVENLKKRLKNRH